MAKTTVPTSKSATSDTKVDAQQWAARAPLPLVQARDMPGMVLAALAAIFVYLNSLEGAFVYDDMPAVVDNPDVDASKTPFLQLFRNNFWGQGMSAFDTQHQVRLLLGSVSQSSPYHFAKPVHLMHW